MTGGADAVAAELRRLQEEKGWVVAAIDGRCASGKSTLAAALSAAMPCNVFHMDDFFLRPEQRTQTRYREPGGNVDRERFYSEVLRPVLERVPFSYRPFCCRTMSLGEPVPVTPAAVTIVEGTYSCHPDLWDCYDLRVFMTTSPEAQLRRIAARDGADLAAFQSRWIPLEERYFAACGIAERCGLRLET